MDIRVTATVENITLCLNEEEAQILNDLIQFAFDYEGVKPGSLYTREKIFGKKLIEVLDNISFKDVKTIKINDNEE